MAYLWDDQDKLRAPVREAVKGARPERGRLCDLFVIPQLRMNTPSKRRAILPPGLSNDRRAVQLVANVVRECGDPKERSDARYDLLGTKIYGIQLLPAGLG